MTATIIPFPRFAYPPHWTGRDQHVFDHLKRCDGLTNEQAARQIELDIDIRREVPGEDESARLLRMARESLRMLQPLNRPR